MGTKTFPSIPDVNLLWALDNVDKGIEVGKTMRYSLAQKPYTSLKDGSLELTDEGRELLERAWKWLRPVMELKGLAGQGTGQDKPPVQKTRKV